MTQLFNHFAANCNSGFLGFKPWHVYLEKDGKCQITNFNILPSSSGNSDIPLILLAVIDDLLRIAGLVAVIFVIYGAIQYTTSQGNPDEASKAQTTIQNALIGLVVTIIAVSTVSFLGRSLSQ